jgi:DNA-directed RNA polymerase subunit L
VVFVKVSRNDPTFRELTKLGFKGPLEVWGLPEGLPLAPATLTIDLEASRAVANALRRVAMCELKGYSLKATFSNVGPNCDPHIIPSMLCGDLRQLPLNRAVAQACVGRRFALKASNLGAPGPEGRPGPTPLTGFLVYSGSIEGKEGEPVPPGLFNPSFPLAYLNPGYALEVDDIELVEGRGHGSFDNLVRGAIRPLDVGRHPDDAVRRRDGAAADSSGYTESSSTSSPRRHRLTGVLRATGRHAEAEARSLFSDACSEVARRVSALVPALRGNPAEGGGVSYSEAPLEDGLREGRLSVAGESTTLGELLQEAICETADVAFSSYDIVAHDGSRLDLTVRHACDPERDASVAKVIARAAARILRTFEALSQGFADAPGELPRGYPHPLEPTPQGTERH